MSAEVSPWRHGGRTGSRAASQRSGPRKTPQKDAVQRALEGAEGFISAKQLRERLGAAGSSVGMATVYRQLRELAESGRADVIWVSGGRLFRACGMAVHRHRRLVCEACGVVFEIDPPGEDWILSEARSLDFTVTQHVFEVSGLCVSCRAT